MPAENDYGKLPAEKELTLVRSKNHFQEHLTLSVDYLLSLDDQKIKK